MQRPRGQRPRKSRLSVRMERRRPDGLGEENMGATARSAPSFMGLFTLPPRDRRGQS